MLISSKRTQNVGNFDIYLNDQKLENVNNTKYLGVVIDQNLIWQNHINYICKKVAPQLAALRRLSNQVPKEVLSAIYLNVIQPSIDYADTVWGNCPKTYRDMVQRLQNSAARAVSGNFDFINFRGIDIVRELGWQNFEERRHFHTASLVFKCVQGNVPLCLENTFTMASSIHDYPLRDRHHLVLPHPYKESFKRSFAYDGAKIWNQLPYSIKKSETIVQFKENYKNHYYN